MEEVETKKGKFKIPVKLTMQERASAADKLSTLEQEKNRATEEYRGHRKLFTIQMLELRDKAAAILSELQNGVSEREVNCEQVFFHTKGIVKFVDTKSKTTLFERPMTEVEMEPTFFPDPPKEKCKHMVCVNCGEKWFGGENNKICWNCKKLDQYRFAEGT